MADVITTAYTIIFIGILLLVGVLIFATVADPMGDQLYEGETLIAAGCSNESLQTFNVTACTGTANHLPIENVTRAAPVLTNCTGASCTAMTAGTDYNYTTNIGLFHVFDDINNGTIKVTYWENTALASADKAQQSITGTVYGGFDLATVMVIVMAAVGIISTIFLIGRREG